MFNEGFSDFQMPPNLRTKVEEMKKKWRCVECGYIHEGEYPPDTCPICYAPSDAFVEVVNA